jgi:hypothetical protein
MGNVRVVVASLLAAATVAGSARAQTSAQSFGELQRVLKPVRFHALSVGRDKLAA